MWPLLLLPDHHVTPAAGSQVFKHHHEESTGRTSSIGQHNLCLDSRGSILNDSQFRNTNCGDYVKHASKVVTLVDLAGAGRWCCCSGRLGLLAGLAVTGRLVALQLCLL
jgi:GTPase